MMRLLATVLALGYAALGSMSGASAGDLRASDGGGACDPAGSTTLKESARARVFYTDREDPQIYGCLFARGELISLDPGETPPGNPYGKPYALAGKYVASVIRSTNPDIQEQQAYLVVESLADRHNQHFIAGIFRRDDQFDYFGYARAVSLVVKPDGSAAWISAAAGFAQREVYRVDARGVKRLDRASQVKGHSLRIHGDRLTWINDSKTRHASLH